MTSCLVALLNLQLPLQLVCLVDWWMRKVRWPRTYLVAGLFTDGLYEVPFAVHKSFEAAASLGRGEV